MNCRISASSMALSLPPHRPETMTAMTSNPHETARSLVADMTEDEKLWCLDGDAPFWAGLGVPGPRRLPQGAVLRRRGRAARAARHPRSATARAAWWSATPPASRSPWPAARRGTPTSRSASATRSAASCAPSARTSTGGVCVNVLRHPAWGRAQETYGEDPHHVGELGAALTRGVQRHVMACVKHFACNSMENARFRVDIEVDEVALHEVYLPHFRRIVDEGVAVVMTRVQQRQRRVVRRRTAQLLTDVLRDEWGFEGFVISDWIFGLRDAAHARLTAGLDIEMPYRMVRADGTCATRSSAARTSRGTRSTAQSSASLSTLLRFDDVLSAPTPDCDVLGCARAPRARARGRRQVGRPAPQRAGRRRAGAAARRGPSCSGSRCSAGSPTIVNLGDGGSSDVWAPRRASPCSTGFAAALPDADVVHDDGADIDGRSTRRRRCRRRRRRRRLHVPRRGRVHRRRRRVDLRSLLPEHRRPERRSRASRPRPRRRRPVGHPEHVRARRDEGGFARRRRPHVAAPPRRRRRAHPRRRGGEPPHGRRDRRPAAPSSSPSGSTRCPRSCSPGTRGWKAATRSPTCCSARSTPPGRLPFTRARSTRADLPPFDRDADHFVYDRWHGWWHLARDGNAPAYPVRVRPRLHDVRAGGSECRGGRGRDPDPHDVAQHGIAKGHRRRADLFGRPAPTRRVRTRRDRPGRDRRARHHGAVRDACGAGCRAARDGGAAGHVRAACRSVRCRRGHRASPSRSAQLLDRRHHVGGEEPQVAL